MFMSIKENSRDFRRTSNSVFIRGRSTIPPLINGSEVLTSASNKEKLFVENLSKKSNLDNLGISLLVFRFRTNPKLYNFSVTPKFLKMVMANLHSSKATGPDCISVVVF